MDETAAMLIITAILALYVVDKLFSHLEKRKLQDTINELSSKLMAKDYREYTQLSRPESREEKPMRNPQSWHDDPMIEIDDDTH
ncbi:hypothetical protein CF651_22945 [Paenibacillus rigui]|uniref:Uncharacterized protein n=2 Tax=Paenibacillus rigui TaxID=554312 RepID=A0A229UKR1_9BACL|nr:hypothetical protein CF651_22945 [Paenibacillus rigui]